MYRSLALHLALSAGYAVLALIHTYPLVLHLDSRLPGEALTDNISFAWNIWWMREATSSSAYAFFESPLILAPLGGSLVQHTHTALSALAGATLLAPLPVVEAQNVALIASLALNGLTTYLLALAVTGARWPSIAAGGLFLLAPAISGRLLGHYNLVLAWPLVLACFAFVMWWRVPSARTTIALALCAALVPYADYYYAMFFLVFAAGSMAIDLFDLQTRRRAQPSSWSGTWLLAAAAVAFVLAALIAFVPPGNLRIGSTIISLETPTNALLVAWALTAAALVLRWRPQARVSWRAGIVPLVVVKRVVPPALIALVLVAPLIVPAWQLWQSGGYVTSTTSFKSSPRGVDLGTVLLGPPHNGMLGRFVRDVYRGLGIDVIESSAWLGATTLALLVVGVRRHLAMPEFRRWLVVGAMFAVWALGPSLTVFAANTGLLLPQAAAQLVPVLNNARIPGRAMTMVALSASVLVAITLAQVRWTPRGRAGALAVAVLALTELLAAPLPLAAVPEPGVYHTVRADTGRGAVLTLPFGVRDGFGQEGVFEHDALHGQTIHRHPIVGGFLARVPRKAWQWYEANEPFASLLRLSEATTPERELSCAAIRDGLRTAGVEWVVVYPAAASDALRSFVERAMPMTPVASDERRILYRIVDGGAAGGACD